VGERSDRRAIQSWCVPTQIKTIKSARRLKAFIWQNVRSKLCLFVCALGALPAGFAQEGEIGGFGGYGWNVNPSLSNSLGSAVAGFTPKGAIGAVLGDDMYEYIGGEIRYTFQFGGPELRSGGYQVNMMGYTNLVTYDLLIHIRPKDDKLRPFVAGGAGIKVFSGTGIRSTDQPLSGFALLSPCTEVEPAISAGGGLKYRITKHAQLRLDFRTYFSPLPHRIFRTAELSLVHGWVYDFVPMVGISYLF
jgi:Outer membrane protein beta-barrel domain